MTAAAKTGAPAQEAAALNHRLERLARAGEWRRLGELTAHRDRLLAAVPAAAREEALRAAMHATGRCLALARAARTECAARLRDAGRGRLAAASYRQHSRAGGRTGAAEGGIAAAGGGDSQNLP